MKLSVIPLLLPLLLWSYFCDAYKVLVVFQNNGRSIIKLGHAYVRILLEAGHEVTYITSQPVKPQNNLHQIQVSNSTAGTLNYKELINKKNRNLPELRAFALKIAEETLKNENVLNLMYDETQNFELVISLWLHTEIMTGLSVVFDCPFIWASVTEVHPYILGLIDEAPNPAYMTDMTSTYIAPLTFYQHLKELWVQGFTYYITRYYFDRQEEVYETIFGPVVEKRGRKLPPFEQTKHNASLLFLNSHYSFGQAPKLPQNFKMIGGYHIDAADIKPLQGELSVFMDKSVNGTIYFSIGSNLKSKDLPQQILRELFKMFGALKLSVVWKFEKELQNIPKNIYLTKWAPQISVLAHPNCRLFVTHGGLLSITESIYFGKPIIGIPILLDQFINVKRAEAKGFGKEVEFSDTLAEDLGAAIDEVLNNPRFSEKAKEMSVVYHDRPTPPHKEIIHWAEHVIRTRGAPHLRSPALVVPWYQKIYLDVITIVISIIILINIAVVKFKNILQSQKKKSQ